MTDPTQSIRISELLQPRAVNLQLTGRNRDQVLRQLVDLVPTLSDRPAEKQLLLQALQEREEMHSTGIGDGLALPHTRNTLGGLVSDPLIAFGRHAQGIDYGAIDGRPVHLFFLLLTTSITQHLQVLARMSRLLRLPEVRSGLLTATAPANVLDCMRRADK